MRCNHIDLDVKLKKSKLDTFNVCTVSQLIGTYKPYNNTWRMFTSSEINNVLLKKLSKVRIFETKIEEKHALLNNCFNQPHILNLIICHL